MGYPPNPDQPYGHPQQSGPQPYGHGTPPPPGYGYQPPLPPPRKRSNVGLIVLLAVGLPLLVIGGCSALVIAIGSPTPRDTIVSTADGPATAGPATSQPPAQQQQPQPDKPATTARVGETISLEGMQQVKVAVTLNQLFDPATPAQEFMKPKAGHRFVAIQLTLTNQGDATYKDAPTNSAHLIDGEGQQYSSSFGEVTEGKAFSGVVTMGGSDSRRGVIVFEVPEAAKLVKLQFALNSGFADQAGEWALS